MFACSHDAIIFSVIDDKLPYHPVDGTLMCMSVLPSANGGHSRLSRTWPSMLEKGVRFVSNLMCLRFFDIMLAGLVYETHGWI
jgi:hypothetical protein